MIIDLDKLEAQLREVYESKTVVQYREGHIDKTFLLNAANAVAKLRVAVEARERQGKAIWEAKDALSFYKDDWRFGADAHIDGARARAAIRAMDATLSAPTGDKVK